MFSQYRNVFTDREKQVIYSLLTRVMDADDIQKDEEKSYLSSMSESLLCLKEIYLLQKIFPWMNARKVLRFWTKIKE